MEADNSIVLWIIAIILFIAFFPVLWPVLLVVLAIVFWPVTLAIIGLLLAGAVLISLFA